MRIEDKDIVYVEILPFLESACGLGLPRCFQPLEGTNNVYDFLFAFPSTLPGQLYVPSSARIR